jgi:hypothetical protein
MNPTLTNSLKGFFLDGSYGFETDSLTLAPPPAGDSNAYAAHLVGTYIDPGNKTYPAFELEGFPRNNDTDYDAVSFNGIEFSWDCPNDTSPQRLFCLVTAPLAPTGIGGNGDCGSTMVGAEPCYDYFSYNLPSVTTWTSINIPFTTGPTAALALQYQGTTTTQYFQTADLTQVLQFLWTSRSNNKGGKYTCDFWLDNVQFY